MKKSKEKITDIKSITFSELTKYVKDLGEQSYRAEQIFNAIHNNMVPQIMDIHVLPKDLRAKLQQRFPGRKMEILEKYDSKLDEVSKYLILLHDKNIIETVLMKYKFGYTQCISTQVGCRMGCAFCASTKNGLIRNLTPAEMIDQIYLVQKNQDIDVRNVVLMGSGEPLDNYDNVLDFLRIIHSPKGKNMSYRNITLSTVGLVPQIYKLAEEKIPITLSISLHSPFDDKRKQVVPMAHKYAISEIISACKSYLDITNRRITIEYALVKDFNDRKKDAAKLQELLRNMLYHINLIPVNPVAEFDLAKPGSKAVRRFYNDLKSRGMNVTIRRELGNDINAACGQLKQYYLDNLETKF